MANTDQLKSEIISSHADFVTKLNGSASSEFHSKRKQALADFENNGFPTLKNEEWKYTNLSPILSSIDNVLVNNTSKSSIDLSSLEIPDSASLIVLENGEINADFTRITSDNLIIKSYSEALKTEEVVKKYAGHSAKYLHDGMTNLNTAFAENGVYVAVKKGKIVEVPLYIVHVNNANKAIVINRNFYYVPQNSQLSLIEESINLSESIYNSVTEGVIEIDGILNSYQLQNGEENCNEVNTRHFVQIGTSVATYVTISLGGGLIRNNLNFVIDAEHSEANMYGLSLLRGNSHVDNHTIADHTQPNSVSNELYRTVVDEKSTSVFNGKIYVRQAAQKTNAFQQNNNILLSNDATVNTKPQLEIWADDVKCSHGCTSGQLDEKALFYLRARGISEKSAKNLLLQAFANEVTEKIKFEPFRERVLNSVMKRLNV